MSENSSAIQSTLVENRVFEPSAATQAAARIAGMDAYNALCAEADADFEGFCGKRAQDPGAGRIQQAVLQVVPGR